MERQVFVAEHAKHSGMTRRWGYERRIKRITRFAFLNLGSVVVDHLRVGRDDPCRIGVQNGGSDCWCFVMVNAYMVQLLCR